MPSMPMTCSSLVLAIWHLIPLSGPVLRKDPVVDVVEKPTKHRSSLGFSSVFSRLLQSSPKLEGDHS